MLSWNKILFLNSFPMCAVCPTNTALLCSHSHFFEPFFQFFFTAMSTFLWSLLLYGHPSGWALFPLSPIHLFLYFHFVSAIRICPFFVIVLTCLLFNFISMLFISLGIFKDSVDTEKTKVSLYWIFNTIWGLLTSNKCPLNHLVQYSLSQEVLLFSWRTDYIISSIL